MEKNQMTLAGKNILGELKEAQNIAAFFGISGLDSKVAASNVIKKFYGIDLLDLFDMEDKHEPQEEFLLTISDIRDRLNMDTNDSVHSMLENLGFLTRSKSKRKIKWALTEKGKLHGVNESNGNKKRLLWKESIFMAISKERSF